MRSLRTLKFVKRFACAAAVVTLVGAIGCAAGAAEVTREALPTVVVFPLDLPEGASRPEVMAAMDSSVRDSLEKTGRYSVIAFSKGLPGAVRLAASDPAKRALMNGPFSSDARAVQNAVKIGAAVHADYIVVGSVDKYAFEAGTNTEIAATVQMVDVASGKVMQTVAVGGRSTSTSGAELDQAAEAAGDAGRKIAEQLSGVTMPTPAPVVEQSGTTQPEAPVVSTEKRHSSKWQWALLLLGIGVLASQ